MIVPVGGLIAGISAAVKLMNPSCQVFGVEPEGASALAALVGPLRDELAGRHVGLVVCGSNIDAPTYTRLLLPD